MTPDTIVALNARLDAVASELDRMRLSRHRQQWPEGHSEDPGFRASRKSIHHETGRKEDGQDKKDPPDQSLAPPPAMRANGG